MEREALAGVRNRWRFLLEFYQARTLILCAPALAVYEASVVLFLLKKGEFRVRFDTQFKKVIRSCKDAYRPGQRGTWLTDEMEQAYNQLHAMGYCHSVEVYLGDALVGGLYGLSLGRMFFGESMFSLADDASKVATVALVEKVKGFEFKYIDCQVLNPHTEALGAVEWPRSQYLKVLAEELKFPNRQGSWTEPEPRVPQAPAQAPGT